METTTSAFQNPSPWGCGGRGSCLRDNQKPPSPSTSPKSSSSSTSNSATNGSPSSAAAPPPPQQSSAGLPPLTPKYPSISSQNPYPTTFIQADTQSFKQVVQMLTGSAETAAKRSTTSSPQNPSHNFSNPNPNPNTSPIPFRNPIPPIAKANKKPAFKLYERRSSMKNLKMISPLIPNRSPSSIYSPRKHQHPEILSPSILDFPSLALSPVTPLSPDPFNRSPAPSMNQMSTEERAIAEKGFYLHPSPRATTPRDAEPPRLLPLFPLSSPRMESSAK